MYFEICRELNLNLSYYRRNLLLVIFVLLLFTLSYGIVEFSESKAGIVNAGVEKCGCSKCHTIELNGCTGCHSSQQGIQKSNESDSIAPGNDAGSHESHSDSNDALGSSPNNSDYNGDHESEMTPNKSKNQKASVKPNK